eukprot:9283019-Heterocapsa_arctica.AAC.1
MAAHWDRGWGNHHPRAQRLWLTTGNHRPDCQAKGTVVRNLQTNRYDGGSAMGYWRGLEYPAGTAMDTIHGTTHCRLPSGQRGKDKYLFSGERGSKGVGFILVSHCLTNAVVDYQALPRGIIPTHRPVKLALQLSALRDPVDTFWKPRSFIDKFPVREKA